MELREVAVGLENVKQIQRKLHRLLKVVSKSTRHRTEQRLMAQHDLHVLIAQAQIQNRLASADLLINLLLVEQLNVVIEVINIDLCVVHFYFLL